MGPSSCQISYFQFLSLLRFFILPPILSACETPLNADELFPLTNHSEHIIHGFFGNTATWNMNGKHLCPGNACPPTGPPVSSHMDGPYSDLPPPEVCIQHYTSSLFLLRLPLPWKKSLASTLVRVLQRSQCNAYL